LEDALTEVPAKRFAEIDLISDQIPEIITKYACRHLQEKINVSNKIFEVVKAHSKLNAMAIRQGTFIDVTLIADQAPTKMRRKRGIRRCTRPTK